MVVSGLTCSLCSSLPDSWFSFLPCCLCPPVATFIGQEEAKATPDSMILRAHPPIGRGDPPPPPATTTHLTIEVWWANQGHMSISWSIIVDRATTPSLTGRHVSPPSSAARGQQPLWLTGPQDGDQTVSNARRHWAGTVKLFCTVEQAKVWGQMDVGLNPRLTTEWTCGLGQATSALIFSDLKWG